jgi:tetrathionate reductase subunit B
LISRRDFLCKALLGAAAVATVELFDPRSLIASAQTNTPRWVFLIDVAKCVGCGLCVSACKLENEVPYDANASFTWVERYLTTKDGETLIDSPKSARDGFTSTTVELGKSGSRVVSKEEVNKAFFVPKLCNQCEHPPCVQVCPVGATYRAPDGVVLVDREWCIACGYCIMACPYGARFFHPVSHTAVKCTFCYHRITKGLQTACVQACPFDARELGNLNDPNDPVTQVISTQPVQVLKDEYGTRPYAFYLGLMAEVR